MNTCPITYVSCADARHSAAGLRLLSPRLQSLADFPYDAATQRREAIMRTGKMSIAGVQPKLSRRDWIDYFARERLELPVKVLDGELACFSTAMPLWRQAIDASFLSETGRQLYRDLLAERAGRLGFAV